MVGIINIFSIRYLQLKTDSAPLDLDLNPPSYEVTVVAYNEGQTTQGSRVSVLINVGDVNDKAPVFNASSYSVTIPENLVRLKLIPPSFCKRVEIRC